MSLAAATVAAHSWAGSWKGNSSRTLSLCLQKISELGKFPRRRSQRLRRMCSHRWHNLVVQIRAIFATERLKRVEASSTLRSNSVIPILPARVNVHA